MRCGSPGLLVLLAACGASSAPSTIAATAALRACPPAEAVRIAEWRYDGSWEVVLSMAPDPGAPLGPRELEEIRDLVEGPLGDQAWIYGVDGTPCAAKVVGYHLAENDLGGPTYRVIAARVEGCPADETTISSLSWAVLGAAEPTGCVAVDPTLVSARTLLHDDVGRPRIPDATLPAAVAAAVPARSCDEPDCAALWQISQIDAGAVDVYEVSMSWLRTDADADPCEWRYEDHHGIYLSRDGGALQRTAMKPLYLDRVLRDEGGPRVLLTRRHGLYGVHELTADGLGAGRVVEWRMPPPDMIDWFTMAPYCGEGGTW